MRTVFVQVPEAAQVELVNKGIELLAASAAIIDPQRENDPELTDLGRDVSVVTTAMQGLVMAFQIGDGGAMPLLVGVANSLGYAMGTWPEDRVVEARKAIDEAIEQGLQTSRLRNGPKPAGGPRVN